jgi:hypothetical protein
MPQPMHPLVAGRPQRDVEALPKVTAWTFDEKTLIACFSKGDVNPQLPLGLLLALKRRLNGVVTGEEQVVDGFQGPGQLPPLGPLNDQFIRFCS